MSGLLTQFDILMGNLEASHLEAVKAFRKHLDDYMTVAESDAEDAEWLSCLEDAGVDNWSGIDYAHDLRREREQ